MLNGQISFHKYYTNNGVDKGGGVVELDDSSLVVTGSSSSFYDGPSQVFLLKLDSLGDFLWSRSYGGAEIEEGRRVLYKKDFGFFICGFTNSYGNGGFDNYLIKTDELGELEWEKTYGGEGWEKVHDAALTRDTGVIMVGETNSTVNGDKDMFIVRTSSTGDTLWTRSFGGEMGDDYLTSIKTFNDSTFAIGGSWFLEDSLKPKGYVSLIQDDGTVLWESTFGLNGSYWLQDIEFQQGIIRTVGKAKVNDDIDTYISVMSMNGEPYGDYVDLSPGDRIYNHLVNYGDDSHSYVAIDVEDQWSFPHGEDVRMGNFEVSTFQNQGEYIIANEQPDISNDLIRTMDGGVVVVGYSTDVASGGNEIFVVKIGPNNLFPDQNDITINDLIGLEEYVFEVPPAVYPNPANNELTISSLSNSKISYELINAYGMRVQQGAFYQLETLNISSLPDGLYLIELISDKNEVVRKKVLIQR